jgi:hypothetical protein
MNYIQPVLPPSPHMGLTSLPLLEPEGSAGYVGLTALGGNRHKVDSDLKSPGDGFGSMGGHRAPSAAEEADSEQAGRRSRRQRADGARHGLATRSGRP